MPDESTQQWPDLLPVHSVEVGRDGVRIVLAEMPEVAWTVWCVMHKGRPRVSQCTAESTQPGQSWLDEHAGRPPYMTLASIWARCLGVDPRDTPTAIKKRQKEVERVQQLVRDGANPDDFPDWDHNPFLDPAPRFDSLGKKPDARREKSDPKGYAADMHEWTRPIAEVVRWATAQNRPIAKEVALHLSPGKQPFSSTYAERLIGWAHDPGGHDLPRRTRKATTTDSRHSAEASDPTGRTDK